MFRDLHDAALALWGPIVEGGHPRPTGATCARCAQEERALLFYAAALPEGSASERLLRAVQEAPWTDRPALDSAVLARAVRELNDWTGFVDDDERDEVLRPWLLAPASAGSPDRDRALALALVNDAVRVVAPSALDAAGLCSHAEALRALAPVRDGATALIAAAVAAKASAVPVPDGLPALERRRITGARAAAALAGDAASAAEVVTRPEEPDDDVYEDEQDRASARAARWHEAVAVAVDVGKIAAEVAQAAAAMEDPRDRAAVTAPLRALVARLVGVAGAIA